MELYLMQHGIANPKEKDIEEHLSERGKTIVMSSAKALKKINISFDVILCSPKKRSIETAEIIAEEFHFPIKNIIETEKVKPTSPAEEALDFCQKYERVFIAGHLPSIKEIISFLLYPTSLLEVDIQNGGCTRMQIIDNKAILKWHLVPDILKLI